jgi:hypothetical protein
MPTFCVYALSRDFPRELPYKDGIVRLELVRGETADGWMLRAKKVVEPTICPIVCSRFGRYALETTLRSGFVVEEGTPAAKLLDRLVQDGFATKRNASRRDLH